MLTLVLQGLSPSARQGQRQHFGNAERSTQHLCSCLRHAAGGIALLTYPFSFPQLRAAAAPEAPFQLSTAEYQLTMSSFQHAKRICCRCTMRRVRAAHA